MSDETPKGAAPEQPQKPRIERISSVPSIQVNNIDEIAAMLASARSPETYNPSVPFTVMHNSMKPIDLERYMPHPSRIKKHISFTSASAFLAYFEEFKVGMMPKLFVHHDGSGLQIKSIMDFDLPGKVNQEQQSYEAALPSWCNHVVDLVLAYHPDYADLKIHSGKWMSQQDLALFIEENRHLFIEPASADMLELAQHLKGTINVTWQSGKRLSNNQTAMEYKEEIKGQMHNGAVEVPDTLKLSSPIYDGLGDMQYNAAFRWRINGEKKAEFQFKLLTKLEERQAENNAKSQIAAGTGLVLHDVADFDGIGHQGN